MADGIKQLLVLRVNSRPDIHTPGNIIINGIFFRKPPGDIDD